MSGPLYLGIIFLLGSGFYSGLETAIVCLNRPRVRSHYEKGSRRAKILENFLRDREKLLTTTLLGTNLCNVSATVMAVRLGESFGHWGAVIAGGLVFVLLLLFGEYIPKVLFQRHPTRMALLFAYPLWWSFLIFKPVVLLATGLARGVLMLLRVPSGGENPMVTREELKLLIRSGEQAGTLTTQERKLVHSVLDTRGKNLREVMLPIEKAICLSSDSTIEEACARSRQTGYSRIPLTEELFVDALGVKRMRVIGVFNLYDILFRTVPMDPTVPAKEVARAARFLKPGTKVSSALQQLRSGRQPIAMIGEEGDINAIGMVTIEDLLNVVIGDVEA